MGESGWGCLLTDATVSLHSFARVPRLLLVGFEDAADGLGVDVLSSAESASVPLLLRISLRLEADVLDHVEGRM